MLVRSDELLRSEAGRILAGSGAPRLLTRDRNGCVFRRGDHGPIEGEGMTGMTKARRTIAVQAPELRVCAPGRTRTCNLRIRSKTTPVRLVGP